MDAALEELIAQYTRELPGKAEELRTALAPVLSALDLGQSPKWDDLEYFAHKLTGSSGTYGFLALSNVCRHLEEAITDGRLPDSAPPHAAEHLRRWLKIFDEYTELASTRQTLGSNQEAAALSALGIHLGGKAA